MRLKRWLAACTTVLTACTGPPERASSVRVDAGTFEQSTSARPAPSNGKAWALSAAKLDAYLRYQKELLKLYEAASKDGAARARREMRTRAAAEEKAREANGLSEADVDQTDRLVNAVIPKRAMLGASDYDGLIAEHEKLLESLPAESRPSVLRQIDQLKQTRDGLEQLQTEREQFGSANVDAVLSRERELTRNWNRMVQIWTAAK